MHVKTVALNLKKKIILLSCTHLRKLVCILVKTLRMKKSLGQVSTTFKLFVKIMLRYLFTAD